MAGNREGARKGNATKDKKYGVEWRTKLASTGGKMSTPGGFGTTKIGADGMTGQERAKFNREKQLKEKEDATTRRNDEGSQHPDEGNGESAD